MILAASLRSTMRVDVVDPVILAAATLVNAASVKAIVRLLTPCASA
jgi:hypothetical protein